MPHLNPLAAELVSLRDRCQLALQNGWELLELPAADTRRFVDVLHNEQSDNIEETINELNGQTGSVLCSKDIADRAKSASVAPVFVDEAVLFSDTIRACAGNIQCMQIAANDIIRDMRGHQRGLRAQQDGIEQILQLKCLFDARRALSAVGGVLERVRALVPAIAEYKSQMARQQLGSALALLRALKSEPLCERVPFLAKMVSIEDGTLRQMASNFVSGKLRSFLAASDRQPFAELESLEVDVAGLLAEQFREQLSGVLAFKITCVDEFKYVIKKQLKATAMFVSNATVAGIEVTKQQIYELSRLLNETWISTLRPDGFSIMRWDDIDLLSREQCASEMAVESCYALLERHFSIDLRTYSSEALEHMERAFLHLREFALEMAIEERVFGVYTYKGDVYVEDELPVYIIPMNIYTYKVDVQNVIAQVQEPHFFDCFLRSISKDPVATVVTGSLATRSRFASNFATLLTAILELETVESGFEQARLVDKLFDKFADFIEHKLAILTDCSSIQLLQQLVTAKRDDKPLFGFLQRQKSFSQLSNSEIEQQCVFSAEAFDCLTLSQQIFTDLKFDGEIVKWIQNIVFGLADFIILRLFNFEFVTEQMSANPFYHSSDSQQTDCESPVVETITEKLALFLKPMCLLQQSTFYHFLKTSFIAQFEAALAEGIAGATKSTSIGRNIMLNDIDCFVNTCEMYEISIDGAFLRSMVEMWFNGDEMDVRNFYEREVGWKKDSVKSMLLNQGGQLTRSEVRDIIK